MQYDDFYVIEYRILQYLYDRFKKQEKVDANMVRSEYFNIEHEYWRGIMRDLNDKGYVLGFSYRTKQQGDVKDLESSYITVNGINFLFSEPLMREAKAYCDTY